VFVGADAGVPDEIVGVTSKMEGVRVKNIAPGVRKLYNQAGAVKMDESTGSLSSFGLFVRKSLFGFKWDSMLVFDSQMGGKPRAKPPAMNSPMVPRIKMMILTNRRDFSWLRVFINLACYPDANAPFICNTELE
jgi:hypothetical protein